MTRKKGFSCIDCRIEKAAGEKRKVRRDQEELIG